MSRAQYGPAAGSPGGRSVLPPKMHNPPDYIRLTKPELHALINVARHELAIGVYVILITGTVFGGKYAGTGAGHYQSLQALLRPPRPEKGQWAPAPSRKRLRTCLDALEAAGLLGRDKASNQAQGEFRYWLPHRVATRAS